MSVVETNAITKSVYYKYYDMSSNIDVGNLVFANTRLYVHDNFYALATSIINNTEEDIEFTTKTYYYDANLRQIARSSTVIPKTANPGINEYKESIEMESSYNFDEIRYFSIEISTSEEDDIEILDQQIQVEPIYKGPEISYSYMINDYDVNIKVNESNILDITEKITVNFNEGKHGIIRKIPIKNKIIRQDGTSNKIYAQIMDMNVDNEFTTSIENGYYIVKIGSTDKLIDGRVVYTINYRYNLGRDTLKDKDEFYFNIIGTEWTTIIENVSFTIDMPKNFDKKNIELYVGPKGSYKNDNLKYSVDGTQIRGNYKKTLAPNNAITIYLNLEEGYFKNSHYVLSFTQTLVIISSIIFFIVTLIIWYKQHDPSVETVEFYPPEKFNSLELSFAYKGKAEKKDVLSLLIYLADKGYIKIQKIESNNEYFEDFKIIKIKEYIGGNDYERKLMEGLFKSKSEIKVSKTKMIKLIESILQEINSPKNIERIISKDDKKIKWLIAGFEFVVYLLMSIPLIIKYSEIKFLSFFLLICTIGTGYMTHQIFKVMMEDREELGKSIFLTFLMILCVTLTVVFFVIVIWYYAIYPSLEEEPFNIIISIISFASIFSMETLAALTKKRTAYGISILGRIKGFKNFIKTVKKEKLDTIILENPNYFYDILPYAYVLNISDKWIEKFETMIYESEWYDNKTVTNIKDFGKDIVSFMSSLDMINSNSKSSDNDSGNISSSGSSGGGSSGGGAGGGGGSTW